MTTFLNNRFFTESSAVTPQNECMQDEPQCEKRFAYIPLLQIREPKKAIFKLDHYSKHHLVTSELHPFEIYADHL